MLRLLHCLSLRLCINRGIGLKGRLVTWCHLKRGELNIIGVLILVKVTPVIATSVRTSFLLLFLHLCRLSRRPGQIAEQVCHIHRRYIRFGGYLLDRGHLVRSFIKVTKPIVIIVCSHSFVLFYHRLGWWLAGLAKYIVEWVSLFRRRYLLYWIWDLGCKKVNWLESWHTGGDSRLDLAEVRLGCPR